MTTITPETLAELKRLEAAATRGPWKKRRDKFNGNRYIDSSSNAIIQLLWHKNDKSEENAALITAARNALRPLIDEVEKLQQWHIKRGQLFDQVFGEKMALETELSTLRRQLAEAQAEVERLESYIRNMQQSQAANIEAQTNVRP